MKQSLYILLPTLLLFAVAGSGASASPDNPYAGLNRVTVHFAPETTVYEAFAVMEAAQAERVYYQWYFPEAGDTRGVVRMKELPTDSQAFEEEFWQRVAFHMPSIKEAGCWETHTCPVPTVYGAVAYARMGSLAAGGLVTEVDFGGPAGVEVGGHDPAFFQVFQQLVTFLLALLEGSIR
jgi:hypothetical protein